MRLPCCIEQTCVPRLTLQNKSNETAMLYRTDMRSKVDITINRRIVYGSFRITSRINPRHQYHPESFSSRVDTGCDTERAISYYVYHILKHEKVLFCIMNLQSRDQYHFKGYDKGVMISISVTADKYSRNVLSILYMQISLIQY